MSSTPNTGSPTAAEGRLLQLDVLRGMALLGVLLVNLSVFSGAEWAQEAKVPYPLGWGGALSQALRDALLETKAAALLSMLFGAGLAIQLEACQRRGQPHLPFLLRRVAGLALLGCAHSFLLWDGDILLDYALISLLMLPVLRLEPRRILWGIPLVWLLVGLVLLPLAEWIGMASHRIEQATAYYAMSTEHYRDSSWVAVLKYRSWEMVHILGPIRLSSRLPMLAPFFVLGVFFWKKGYFSSPERHRQALLRMAVIFGVLGLAANLLPKDVVWAFATKLPLRPLRILIRFSYVFARPGLTLGYAAGALLLLEQPTARRLMRHFAPLGRMTLTQYLLQSLICTWVFNGYGLGLYGKVPVSHFLAGGVLLFALQVWTSHLWLARFRMGPAEWLWRWFTYRTPQPGQSVPPVRSRG